MNRTRTAAVFIVSATLAVVLGIAPATGTDASKWELYAEQPNGDLYFYDPSRVEKTDTLRQVWSGVRYKTSVMGAFSFESLLQIDCSEGTVQSLQSTFFSDKNWERAAMKTDKSEKPKSSIAAGSTEERLAEIVCD